MTTRGETIDKLRRKLAAKQGWRCYYCDCPVNFSWRLCEAEKHRSLTLEHYVPRSMGGRDNAHDCVVSCRACDVAKGNMHGDEYMALIDAQRKIQVPEEFERRLVPAARRA